MTNAIDAPLMALADPTRRAVFERIARSPSAVIDIANEMPVSRPAVSQHLKVLKAAALVTETAQGARRIYRIDPRGLGELRMWLERFWPEQLTACKDFAERQTDREGS